MNAFSTWKAERLGCFFLLALSLSVRFSGKRQKVCFMLCQWSSDEDCVAADNSLVSISFRSFCIDSASFFFISFACFRRRIAVLRHCCQALSFALCALCTPNRIMKMCTKHRRQESKSNHYTSVRLQLVTVTEKSLKQNGIIAENHQLRKHSRAQRCKKIQPKSLWEHQNQHGNKWTTTKSANTSNTATESVNEKRKKKHP